MADLLETLAPEDAASYQAKREALLGDRFVDIEHDQLVVGARVRNRGEQYSRAYRYGTGVVLAVMRQEDSAWEREWGRPNIEVLVLRDEPFFSLGRITLWADYGTFLAEIQEPPE